MFFSLLSILNVIPFSTVKLKYLLFVFYCCFNVTSNNIEKWNTESLYFFKDL